MAHPIAHAWISSGGTGAQNYDEFADDAEITAIIEANPASALAIEMPHRAPESLGISFADALPIAVQRLDALKSRGRLVPQDQVAVAYRITGDEAVAYGLFCMIDTDQISTSAEQPGMIIRNEDVFIEKVRERVALADALGHLLSPVLLLQTGSGEELHAALAAAIDQADPPATTELDAQGRRHEMWPLAAGAYADRLLALAGSGEMVVADGNHRSLAAQIGGLARFLAVVTTAKSVTIQPYHRLVTDGTVDDLPAALVRDGATVTPLSEPIGVPAQGGVIHLYTAGAGYAVRLPATGATAAEQMDHAVVERTILIDVLGMDPGDKRITYVGGDYPASWLLGEVDAGRAALAVLIAPVTVEDFLAVNLARQQMPRKSTWFTPKARAGLVVAELERFGK